MTLTIYHNPACGTSRNTLEMMRQSGEDPVVIEYLQAPPTREKLVNYSVIVVLFMLFMMVIIGLLDTGATQLVNLIMSA